MPTYSNIRYAHAERFTAPVATPPLSSLEQLPKTQFIAPQNPCRLEPIIGAMGQDLYQGEDCLSLTVCTPSTTGSRPVLVFIHGGAFLTGSGEFAQYSPERLSNNADIVVVNISYRLGALGFLYTPERGIQNLGIHDQACALEWVRQNIHLFGGDPTRVTLMGQSAGASSILALIATLDHNLFSQAIIASAPFFPINKRQQNKASRHFLDQLHDPYQATISQILSAQSHACQRSSASLPFCPVIDDIYRPQHIMPGLQSVMLWCQQDDAIPFVPRIIEPIVTRYVFQRPMISYAHWLSRHGILTSTLTHTWRHHVRPFRATHCIELPLLFGDWPQWCNAPFLHDVTLEEYKSQSAQLQHLVANFVQQVR